MKKEREKLLKTIMEDIATKSINYSENTKRRFLERISSNDGRIKELVYAYLSCQSIKEQEVFLDSVSQNDKDSFSVALQEIASWYPSNAHLTA